MSTEILALGNINIICRDNIITFNFVSMYEKHYVAFGDLLIEVPDGNDSLLWSIVIKQFFSLLLIRLKIGFVIIALYIAYRI